MEKDLFKSRVRLRHLDCFVCVAETGHLGKAAARLRLTQPAVSKTLNELEEIVGQQLLARGRAGSSLTPEGKRFLAHASAVMAALHAAQASVAAAPDAPPAVLRVGALPTVAPAMLPAALQVFRERYPRTRVEVRTGTNGALIAMLRAGEIDLAVARMAEPESMLGLSFELLHVEPVVLAVRPGHPLAGRPISLDEAAAYPIVISASGTVPRHHTESMFRSRGLALPEGRVETLSVSLSRQLARHGDSIWFTPAGTVHDDVRDGVLALLVLPTTGMEEPVGLLRQAESTPGIAAAALINALRDEAGRRR
ncbi:LysR substrate-binding domain-containing protein [Noviherbaspirillum aridicola]|uniref:Transcriptional regulator n=1 Tax=Noviherbaspirillum aridicola TaxID=2849687 RepID=A0ABQ4Q088_9BURK|nr:LysR substrate-binding domain-containing protein [Noviherbaspirillum aridicola]GIZ50550.1 transcriptional regulator [Noviherbaspirillum aridicola]